MVLYRKYIFSCHREGLGSALRIPLGDEEEWARKVLNFPEDYLMPCIIAVGKPCNNAEKVQQKNIIPDSVIHKNIWEKISCKCLS